MDRQLPDLFLDVDSTLITPLKEISTENQEAIKAYVKAGGHVHLVTGKVTAAIIELVKTLEIDQFAHAGANGGMIYEMGEEKLIYSLKYLAKPVIEVLTAFKQPYYIYYADKTGYAHLNPEAAQINKIIAIKEPTPVYELEPDFEKIVKVLIFLDEEKEVEPLIRNALKEVEALNIMRTAPTLLEFHHIGMTKANALDYIQKDKTRITIAVGDSDNDLSMLEKANYGFIVENASDKIKALGYQQLPTCDADGVSYLIHALLNGVPIEAIGIKK